MATLSIAFTSQGTPKTWVAKIAVVFSVMAASILEGSRLNDLGSISTKTGVHPSQAKLDVVATYEKGVVITSPSTLRARKATCMAIVPLLTTAQSRVPK